MADHEIWPLGLGVLLASFSVRLAPWGLGLIGVLWGLRWLARGRLTVRTPWDWPLGLLVLMVPVTLLVTPDRGATFLAVSRLLAGLSLAYAIANWSYQDRQWALFAWGLTVAAVLLSLVGFLCTRWQGTRDAFLLSFYAFSFYRWFPDLESVLLNPNMVAGALVLLLPFPLAGLLWNGTWPSFEETLPSWVGKFLGKRHVRTVGLSLALGLLLGVLFLTQSRGSWLAAGAAVGLLLIGRFKAARKLAPAGLLFAVGGVAWWQSHLGTALEAAASGSTVIGWPERVEIWSRALYMIRDFPFTGIGADTYPLFLKVLYPLFLVSPTAEIPHAHNLLLQVAVDLGLPGLIAFLAVVGLSFYSAGRVIRCGRAPFHKALAWTCLAGLTAMLVHGMVDATSWIVGWGAPLPWAIIGLIMALARPGFESWVVE